LRPHLAPSRYRIGMLIPSSNVTIEREYAAVMPPDFSFHFGRLPMTALTDEGIRRQTADLRDTAARLGDARMNLMLFCQTAASFWLGRDWDEQARQEIASASGARSITAAGTVLDALRALGVRRVGFGAPFPEEVGRISITYLERNGIEVVASHFLGIRDNAAIADIGPEQVKALARRADHPRAQAILLPGGNMPCLHVAEDIERELGKPMLCTNQAGMWAILDHFGAPERIEGCGRLLRERPPIR